MTIVSLEDVNQENICCLNTAILFIIFAQRSSGMGIAKTLHEIRKYEDRLQRPGHITTNFRELLWFWQQYYACRAHDAYSLEVSSQIPFQEWFTTVKALYSPVASDTSLVCEHTPFKNIYTELINRCLSQSSNDTGASGAGKSAK